MSHDAFSKVSLWLHPEVALLYAPEDSCLNKSVCDWQNRVGSLAKIEDRLYIFNLSVSASSAMFRKEPPGQQDLLTAFKPQNCETVLLEKCDRLMLKVFNHRYTWGFVIDLMAGEVYIDYHLLCFWGMTDDYQPEIVPSVETWLADAELASLTAESATDLSDRLLLKSIKLENLNLDCTETMGLLLFEHEDKFYKIKCGLDFFVALEQVCKAASKLTEKVELMHSATGFDYQ